MLQQLLNVARGTSDSSELCSLSEVIAAAWAVVAPSAEARHIELRTELLDGLECPMERARMERVFSNLFENAIEAIRSGGTISVRSKAEGDSLVVEVHDTGPGISPALRGRLFQPFVTAGKKNGLGLGLALSRQTLLDHGGDMWADSERTRRPVLSAAAPRTPRRDARDEHRQPGRRLSRAAGQLVALSRDFPFFLGTNRPALAPANQRPRYPDPVSARRFSPRPASIPETQAARRRVSRSGAQFSPTPPVNTSASTPPSTASIAPISRISRCA